MNNTAPRSPEQYFEVLRRRRRIPLVVIPCALFIAGLLAFLLPPSYRSSATILLEPASIPKELIRTTVTDYADEQIELVQRRLLSSSSLERLVADLDPYPELPEASLAGKASLLQDNILLERVDPITMLLVNASNAFSIHYTNPDPEIAAAVAQKVADLFLEDNRLARNERAEDTHSFIRAQAADVEERIAEVDRRLARFKSRYGDALPDAQARNIAAIERLDRDIRAFEAQLRSAEDRKALLQLQARQVSPYLTIPAAGASDLATMRAELAEARTRYTANHPDVRRLERQLELALGSGLAGPGGQLAQREPDNPEYLALQAQLQGLSNEISALSVNATRARRQIGEYDSKLTLAPEVEREYSELTRIRQVLLVQFNDVQAKLREADVARDLESEQRGARFVQIRFPRISDSPYEPNRPALLLVGLLFGLAASVLAIAIREGTDPTVRGLKDLDGLPGVAVLASIPVLLNDADRAGIARGRAIYAGAVVAGILAVAILALA